MRGKMVRLSVYQRALSAGHQTATHAYAKHHDQNIKLPKYVKHYFCDKDNSNGT